MIYPRNTWSKGLIVGQVSRTFFLEVKELKVIIINSEKKKKKELKVIKVN